MADVRELPDMVGDFFDLTKDYLRQETIEPMKRLGRLAAFSAVGAIFFVIAAVFLAVAGMRFIVAAMPDGAIWSGVGYIAASLAIVIVTGLVIWRAVK